jgi:hypothetical protein
MPHVIASKSRRKTHRSTGCAGSANDRCLDMFVMVTRHGNVDATDSASTRRCYRLRGAGRATSTGPETA